MSGSGQQIDELIGILQAQLAARRDAAFSKFDGTLAELQNDFSRRRFYYLFGICQRLFGRDTCRVAGDALAQWQRHDPHGVLRGWSHAQLARLLLLLRLARDLAPSQFAACVDELFQTADVNERVMLVQSLPLLPDAGRFVERARESARSNIVPVFSAIAHNNDYARVFFDQTAWNQLVLKAAFLAVPIWSIIGLRERNNAELTMMLHHYANERQAASRSVPWDLWCCLGWLASADDELDYLQRQAAFADARALGAITLSLSENPHAAARALAATLRARLPADIVDDLNWSQLAESPP